MSDEVSTEAKWYVVHTYSGYENKVKANIEKTVNNRDMHDQILEVAVPLEEVQEEKNGKISKVLRKVFPGYVLVHMIMNDNTWYVVRNTRGVTGFVGPGSKPVPLTDEEVRYLGEHELYSSGYEVGEVVMISDGPMAGNECTITGVDAENQSLSAKIFMMGRETPVELSFSQVKKM
ncbi:MAG: transcription termination/antitermination factor NusG [Firmicutes bacterium]|nr:transcription termination/antitermination factor NusG [Bacillota bacterium]